MSAPINVPACLGTHDVLFITIDTLRYDVAAEAMTRGETPNLASLLPNSTWERRHSPSTFTYAAHHAFFAGFLPTPVTPREENPAAHNRLFAARFPGSETSAAETLAFDTPDIVSGFEAHDYHTICVGGVGFFNKQSPLGSVLPGLFKESHWREDFGVSSPASAANQTACAASRVQALPPTQRAFVFVNFSACHPPHHFYLGNSQTDSIDSQRAALADIDRQLPPLIETMTARAPVLLIICADHGAAFGEDGYTGHRIGHPVVWDVPYAQALLARTDAQL